jgi:hypothetical protein
MPRTTGETRAAGHPAQAAGKAARMAAGIGPGAGGAS